jgi:uncharacterized protein YhaN
MKELAYLNKFFYKYRWRLLPGALFVIISNIFAVLPAQVIRIAFDLVNENIALFRLFNGFNRQELISKIFGQSLVFFGVIVWFIGVVWSSVAGWDELSKSDPGKSENRELTPEEVERAEAQMKAFAEQERIDREAYEAARLEAEAKLAEVREARKTAVIDFLRKPIGKIAAASIAFLLIASIGAAAFAQYAKWQGALENEQQSSAKAEKLRQEDAEFKEDVEVKEERVELIRAIAESCGFEPATDGGYYSNFITVTSSSIQIGYPFSSQYSSELACTATKLLEVGIPHDAQSNVIVIRLDRVKIP